MRWEVDSESSYFKNIITDFGINCESKFGIGLIGSMYYVGEAVGSLVYIVFNDSLPNTRKSHIVFKNILMMIVLVTLITMIRSLLLLYLVVFLIGLCQSVSII